jgi:hypothetical protein
MWLNFLIRFDVFTLNHTFLPPVIWMSAAGDVDDVLVNIPITKLMTCGQIPNDWGHLFHTCQPMPGSENFLRNFSKENG